MVRARGFCCVHPGACLCPQNVAPSPLWWGGFGGRVPGAVPWAGGFSPPFSPRAGGMGLCFGHPAASPSPGTSCDGCWGCATAGNARHRAACGLGAGSRGQEVLGAALGAPITPSCPDPSPRCRRGALGGAGQAGGALLLLVPSTPNTLQKNLSRPGCDFHRTLFTSGVRGDAGWRRDLRGCLGDLFWVLLPLPRVTADMGRAAHAPRGCGTPRLGHPWCWGAQRERGRSAAPGKCPRGWVLCLPQRSPR